MSNKDLLKLENEYRNELPKYTEKPKITAIEKPSILTGRLSSFLASAGEKADKTDATQQVGEEPKDTNRGKMVEMDIYITPTTE